MAQASVFFVLLLVPTYLLFDMCRRTYGSGAERVLVVLSSGLTLLALFYVGRWDLTLYPARYAFPIAFLGAAVFTLRKPLDPAKKPSRIALGASVATTVALLLAAGYVVYATRLGSANEPGVNLRSPLTDGKYVVGHGGSSVFLNYHHGNEAQRYAIDIVGFRAVRNPFEDRRQLASYPVYKRTVLSPCDASVESVENDRPDLVPPETDRENPAGNHVVLRCKGVLVVLAHLLRGSIDVVPGDRVKAGQPMGKVGNSGNTTEPHLHIHAVKEGGDVFRGEGVPLTLDGHYPIRNDIVK